MVNTGVFARTVGGNFGRVLWRTSVLTEHDQLIVEATARRVVEMLSILPKRGNVEDRDYTLEDLSELTGVSKDKLARIRIKGEYKVSGRRKFMRSEIDFLRKTGGNLEVGR